MQMRFFRSSSTSVEDDESSQTDRSLEVCGGLLERKTGGGGEDTTLVFKAGNTAKKFTFLLQHC